MAQRMHKSVVEQTFVELVADGLQRKLTAAQVVATLKARIQRDQRYLQYRFTKGVHTAYDDTTADDLVILALAAAWLMEATPE